MICRVKGSSDKDKVKGGVWDPLYTNLRICKTTQTLPCDQICLLLSWRMCTSSEIGYIRYESLGFATLSALTRIIPCTHSRKLLGLICILQGSFCFCVFNMGHCPVLSRRNFSTSQPLSTHQPGASVPIRVTCPSGFWAGVLMAHEHISLTYFLSCYLKVVKAETSQNPNLLPLHCVCVCMCACCSFVCCTLQRIIMRELNPPRAPEESAEFGLWDRV